MKKRRSDPFLATRLLYERQPLQILGVFAAGDFFEFFRYLLRDRAERRFHRFVVYLNHLRHLRRSAGEETLVRGKSLRGRDGAFFHRVAEVLGEREHAPARDAGEY